MPREWKVPKELHGERLDAALARLAGDISRRSARKLIEQGRPPPKPLSPKTCATFPRLSAENLELAKPMV